MNKQLLLWAALLVGSPAGAQAADMGTSKTGGRAAMCIGCHGIVGYKVAYPQVYHVPLIAGQSAKYLEFALKAYQSGERRHPTMRSIAASLSDKDISDLAAYYSGADQGAEK